MLSRRLYRHFANGLLIAGFSIFAFFSQGLASFPGIRYVSTPAGNWDVILDTRSAALCAKASLQDARCLPASDFFGPHKRLANFSGILWLLGTAGLKGSEHILVAGNNSLDKEAMAGLLLLAGQKQISVLKPAISSVKGLVLVPGIARSKSREEIYQSTMRAERIVLRNDLKSMIHSNVSPVILDGRSENEYWGQMLRSQRGGHIPGAQHLPVSLKDNASIASSFSSANKMPVAYAHNAYEGLVYLSRLESAGISSKLYLEGWSGWASDGALPADSVTYMDRSARTRNVKSSEKKARSNPVSTKYGWVEFTGLGVGGISLALGGFFIGRTMTGARG